jgi:hypothetical protein
VPVLLARRNVPGLGGAGVCPARENAWYQTTPFVAAYGVSKETLWILVVYYAARKWPERF